MKTAEQITEREFSAFEDVRKVGMFNMLTSEALYASGLQKETYTCILNNYTMLNEKFGGL